MHHIAEPETLHSSHVTWAQSCEAVGDYSELPQALFVNTAKISLHNNKNLRGNHHTKTPGAWQPPEVHNDSEQDTLALDYNA